jgi:hypothetical protein
MILTSLTPIKSSIRYLAWIIALFMTVTACDEQDEHPLQSGIDQTEIDNVNSEAELETVYDEIDLISVEANESLEDNGTVGGREQIDPTDRLTRCATVIHDKEAMTITIDFGDGCEGPDGKVRSGIIFITYTDRLFIPGSVWTITSRDYTVNRKRIEGTKTITNVSGRISDHVSFNKVLEGGKVTWPDGSFATREVDKTFTWIRAINPLMDEIHVEGEASGMNRRGVAYKTTIVSMIIWKRACRLRGVCVPVQGLKLIERRDHPDVLLDFGDGECDALITITKNGESRVVEKDCNRMD